MLRFFCFSKKNEKYGIIITTEEGNKMINREEIAQRIAGARDAADLTVEEVAEKLGISVETYKAYEAGTMDVPLGDIPQLAALFNTDPFAIFTGINSHTKVYSVTRNGKGPVVERNSAYHYESLNAAFTGAKVMPYIVTVLPNSGNELIHLNSHPGEEFDRVIEGRLEMLVDGHSVILDVGDTIYFDATKMHGMRALDGKAAKFLAVITSD